MKIVLFRDGQPGLAATLPGEEPEVELCDLLGGETEMIPLNEHMTLVELKDGEKLGLPLRYEIHRLGREPEPVFGDCAVVAVKPDGMLRDVRLMEVPAAEAYVRCAQE